MSPSASTISHGPAAESAPDVPDAVADDEDVGDLAAEDPGPADECVLVGLRKRCGGHVAVSSPDKRW